ncbi:hypothetical protein [Butyrivibrio proteoclasticus]|uniref:hypothetical protein n=1 Tax=Butyrivibrio proteoclasticus TaxID=43305 RepID=UPI00047ACF9A|nr:hypothetical protein [Butyrivibrio proteoclasticus]
MKKEFKREAPIYVAVHVKDYIFFMLRKGASLFSYKIGASEAAEIGTVSWDNRNKERLYEKIIYYKGKLFLIPFLAEYLTIYDIEKKEFSRLNIKNGDKDIFFTSAYICQNCVIILGSRVLVICENEDGYLIREIDDWLKPVSEYVFNDRDVYFRGQAIYQNDKMLIPFRNANALLELDIKNMQSKVHVLGKEALGYSGITLMADGMYCLSPKATGSFCLVLDKSYRIVEKIELKSVSKPVTILGIGADNNKLIVYTSFTNEMHDKYIIKKELLVECDRELITFDLDNLSLCVSNKNVIVYNSPIFIKEQVESLIRENKFFDIKDFLMCIEE